MGSGLEDDTVVHLERWLENQKKEPIFGIDPSVKMDEDSMPRGKNTPDTPALRKHWAKSVKDQMERHGLTGRDVAAAIDCSPQMISEWRAGRNMPSMEHAIRFSHLVNEPLEFLIGDGLASTESDAVRARRLAVRIGHKRLNALPEVSDKDLFDSLDLLIGRASMAAKPRKKTSRKR